MLDVIIVGAGAAGVGLGAAFHQIDLDESNYVILERHAVGELFRRWPAEMRFISPSFNSNTFGLVDLNAITPNTSPAFTLRKEHPSGMDYARYLGAVAGHVELPIRTGVDVTDVAHKDGCFFVRISQGEFTSRLAADADADELQSRVNTTARMIAWGGAPNADLRIHLPVVHVRGRGAPADQQGR